MPNQTNNNVFLDGGSFCLRPLRLEDAKGNYGRWFNDREVVQYMIHGSFPMGEAELETFIRHTHTTRNDLILAVVDKEKQQHVGNIGLHRIDWIRRSAEFGIVIGEKEYWGRGISTEATRLICNYGFSRLNLHRIWLGAHAQHQAAIKSYQKVGFVIEGTLRDDMYTDGKYYDRVIMGLLRDQLK